MGKRYWRLSKTVGINPKGDIQGIPLYLTRHNSSSSLTDLQKSRAGFSLALRKGEHKVRPYRFNSFQRFILPIPLVLFLKARLVKQALE